MKGFYFYIVLALFISEQFSLVLGESKRLLINDPNVLHQELEQLKALVQSQQTELENTKTLVKLQQDKITQLENQKGGGAIFYRWGRKDCPGNDTELVYSGFMGGSSYQDKGAAAEYVCLPQDPQWGQHSDSLAYHGGRMYGAEYHSSFFTKSLSGGNDDAPCAVCRNPTASVSIMIPGRLQCYNGWKAEYSGYLASGAMDHTATQYICLDSSPEILFHTRANQGGALLYTVNGVCGTLSCPPYVNGRELTCVVCSK